MDAHEVRQKVLTLQPMIVEKFDSSHWTSLGFLTGFGGAVSNHPRLLRSLSWGDPDYAACARDMTLAMVSADPRNLGIIERFLTESFGDAGVSVSSVEDPGKKRIYFVPSVFQVPAEDPGPDLVSVMMPFKPELTPVFDAIKWICDNLGWKCQRASDIWQHSTVIQDVFSLIYRSHIAFCDFSGKNPNVFYEAGIAHTLGKHVIPIAQHIDDIPFDLRHHRILQYLNNKEGLEAMQTELWARIVYLMGQHTP